MYGNKRINRKPHKHGKYRDLGSVFMLIELLKLFPWGKQTENEIKLQISHFLSLSSLPES